MTRETPTLIPSDASQGRHRPWLLAGLWWALCLPATLAIPEELARGNTPILFVLLLDAVGVYLFYLALREGQAWRRYGPSPLLLLPNPAQTGQPVTGEIRFDRPLAAEARFWVTLSQIHYVATGSGNTYRATRQIEWQDRQEVPAELVDGGTCLRFRFDIPANAPPSEAPSSHYRFWELMLTAPDLKPTLMRLYPIPVVAGSAAPRELLSEVQETATHPARTEARRPLADTPESIPLKRCPGGLERHEGPRENARHAPGTLLFGLIFGGIGLAMTQVENLGGLRWIFVTPFGLAGALILLYGLALLGGTWYLTLNGNGIQTRYTLLGVCLRQRRIPVEDFGRLRLCQTGQSNRQGEPLQSWSVVAENRWKTLQIPLIENLSSRREAHAAMQWLHQNGPFPMPMLDEGAKP